MASERWRRVEHLYHAALKIATQQRPSFLKEECQGDQKLREESRIFAFIREIGGGIY